ncbi:glycosyltransferase family 4 protein [Parageobacillus thermoglucosidasius]|uniref:glycosyltransferase family 4 protein n=1 Tax=Parageobacillus thermoglucosidasius TaxID=1426 RepID=UPI000B56B787|nr:glycosyltransferase family 4 protein [Parageobacillus thermoglucosidasius]OUM93150.1 MAG: hexosyltransferase [Parageobacillus thermoglucosidasius]
MKRIAFVIPWYGKDIPGGAENACRNLAEKMHQKGIEVEVLTTCVKQFSSDWNVNHHKAGIEIVNGVPVRRFKVRKRNTAKFDEINRKLMMGIRVSHEEEKIFLKEMINSDDLMTYIKENKDRYSAFIFTPYMFGTTFYGVQQVLDKAILLPAFHDESYAYFQSFRETYSKVKGMIFFSEAEREWANRHYDLRNVKQRTLGLGISEQAGHAERFRQKFGIRDPFILYAGRKDFGKNVHVLLDYFNRYHQVESSQVKLVLIGGGKIDIPYQVKDRVLDLGFVSQQDKYDAYAAAEFLCNPSAFESFSYVIMESWVNGRPVLVNSHCEVTKRFCIDSNGGLFFENFAEFRECTRLLLQNKKLSDWLGQNGKNYVLVNFRWNDVIDRYLSFLRELG